MTTFVATLVDGDTGAGNDYRFEDSDTLLDQPAGEVIERFFAQMDRRAYLHEALRITLTNAFRSPNIACVTGWGALDLHRGRIPFMVMIAPEGPPQPPSPASGPTDSSSNAAT